MLFFDLVCFAPIYSLSEWESPNLYKLWMATLLLSWPVCTFSSAFLPPHLSEPCHFNPQGGLDPSDDNAGI